MGDRALRVHVEMSEEFDVDAHALAHARGASPDRTPYGLHHLADPGAGPADPEGSGAVALTYRRPLRGRAAWLARGVRHRLDEHEVVAEALGALRRDRRRADVVLCMDERTGVPAALAPGGPPVVVNLIWVQRPEGYAPVARRVLGLALRRAAGLVVQSESLRGDLVDGWGIDPARVHRVHTGIDAAFFGPQPWTEGTVTVASVGDDRYRDHPLLVDAAARLAARGEAVRLEIGTTIPDVVVPPELGEVHRERMGGGVRDLYRRAGVVALALEPTTAGSGTTVVLEAAASARPVVATRTPAMADLVEDGVRGLLVPPGDPEALADALGTLLADPACARRMGEAARSWLETERTSARMMDEFRGVLRAVVAQAPRSRR